MLARRRQGESAPTASRVDDDLVNRGTDRLSGTCTAVRAAHRHVAELYRGVGGGAGAAPDVLDDELVVLYLDLDIGTDMLLVLHRVGPVAGRVQRVRTVVRVHGRVGGGELVVLRARRGVGRDVDDPARALGNLARTGLLVHVRFLTILDCVAA